MRAGLAGPNATCIAVVLHYLTSMLELAVSKCTRTCLLAIVSLLGICPQSSTAFAQEEVWLDLDADWLRRDWSGCESRAYLVRSGKVITIVGDTSRVLFWQVPVRDTASLDLDLRQRWVRECDRPPPEFGQVLRKLDLNQGRLVQLSDYRHLSWNWMVDGTVDDRRARKPDDQFTARLGVTVVKAGGGDLREIAYVWARSLPEDSVLVERTTVIPGVLQYKWHRIVAQTGEAPAGGPVHETRNIYADYKRLYPKEEPGRVVRVYLCVDSDQPDRRIRGSFSDIRFHKRASTR